MALVIAVFVSVHARAANISAQVIGATPAAVAANFVGVITQNLTTYEAGTRLARLTDAEIQDLAYAYGAHTGGNAYALLSTLITYAPGEVNRYLAAANNAYVAYLGASALRTTQMYMMGFPNIDMTIRDIYLEFRTAPVGALSATSSVYMTSLYVATNLAAAYGVGYTIGTGIHWLIETYAPQLDNTIGAGLDAIITRIATAPSLVSQGFADLQLLSTWNMPMTSLMTYSGDFGDWGIADALGMMFAPQQNLCYYNPQLLC